MIGQGSRDISQMDLIPEARFCAEHLLELHPSPAARLRLLRDVLGQEFHPGQIRNLSKALDQSRHVRLLVEEQRTDGGWGAFHSRCTTSRQKIASTEIAVERAINLGLDGEHPILRKAKNYILSIMRARVPFPDRHERNDRWPTGMRMILASTLSMIDPLHEELEGDRSLWQEIAIRTFQSGMYSQEDEIQAHAALTGATVAGSYLTINNRYALNILGSKPDLLPADIEHGLLNWLWNHDRGIRYLEVPLVHNPPLGKANPLDRWFTSLEMILRLFQRSVQYAEKHIRWIWERRDDQGLWEFGPRSASSTFFPLAENWRRRISRKLDWSARVLLLCAAANSQHTSC